MPLLDCNRCFSMLVSNSTGPTLLWAGRCSNGLSPCPWNPPVDESVRKCGSRPVTAGRRPARRGISTSSGNFYKTLREEPSSTNRSLLTSAARPKPSLVSPRASVLRWISPNCPERFQQSSRHRHSVSEYCSPAGHSRSGLMRAERSGGGRGSNEPAPPALRNYHSPGTSPPARVPAARHTSPATVSRTNRTLPSATATFIPPECRLP